MSRIFGLSLLIAFAFSCARPDASGSLHDVISNTRAKLASSAPFHADSLLSFDHAEVVRLFGEKNLMAGHTDNAFVLFPATDKEVEIIFADSTDHAKVSTVILQGKSSWVTRSGLQVGMHLKDIEQLNGKPFLFYGGGWDQGGKITNWNEGTLSASRQLCRLDRNYLMPYDMSKGDYDQHEFSSDSRDAQRGNPVLEQIILSPAK